MKSYILLFMLEVCFAMPILPAPGTVVPIDVNEQFISPFNRLDESVENALGAVAKAKVLFVMQYYYFIISPVFKIFCPIYTCKKVFK